MANFSFSKKFNTRKIFNIDTEGFDYTSLEHLFERNENGEDVEGSNQVYVVRGLYINSKGLYDASPVAALDDCYVNLPSHLTEVCQEMINDPVAVIAINQSHCGFRIESYVQKKYNKVCYSIEWVDL